MMSINATTAASDSKYDPKPSLKRTASLAPSQTSFAKVIATQNNKAPSAAKQSIDFFTGNPGHNDIANQAASLRLNKQQIVEAMVTAGYGNSTREELSVGIDKFMAANSKAYAWSSDGTLTTVASKGTSAAVSPSKDYHYAQALMTRNAGAAKASDRISTGFGWGKLVTVGQAREFFASRPDDNAILAKAAELNMSDEELATALVFGRGDTFDTVNINSIVNNSDRFGFDREGHIVALKGATKQAQNGNSMLTVYDTTDKNAKESALNGSVRTTA